MSERCLFRNTANIKRIIAISDIHGDGLLLRRLMARLAPGSGDLVVLVGDYINRGPDSDDALHTVMQLSARENVVVLKGNMDRLIDWYFWRGPADLVFGHFREYQANRFGILFFELAHKCGYEMVTPENFEEIRSVLAKRYEAEGQFVRDLPFGLETDSHLFVHAGVCASADWRDSTEQELLKNDPFLMHGVNNTGKTIVVGHTPVWNSPLSKNCNNAIIDPERRVIGIDGGIGVKSFSQLNALVITRTPDGFRYETVFEDRYPRFTARCSYQPQEQDWPVLKDAWPDYYLDVLSRGSAFSLCRLTGSGRTGMVKNEHIGTDANGRTWFTHNSISMLLPVSAGEQLALLDGGCDAYVYVKNAAGAIGWVPKQVAGDAEPSAN